MAEGVAVEAGLPLTGQGEVGGQIADGVGGLGATSSAKRAGAGEGPELVAWLTGRAPAALKLAAWL